MARNGCSGDVYAAIKLKSREGYPSAPSQIQLAYGGYLPKMLSSLSLRDFAASSTIYTGGEISFGIINSHAISKRHAR